jgi:hypothetical protein
MVDSIRYFFGSPTAAFALVFGAEAALFLVAAGIAAQLDSTKNRGLSAEVTAQPI